MNSEVRKSAMICPQSRVSSSAGKLVMLAIPALVVIQGQPGAGRETCLGSGQSNMRRWRVGEDGSGWHEGHRSKHGWQRPM